MSNASKLGAPGPLTPTILSRSAVPSLSQVNIQPYFVQAQFTTPDGNQPGPNNNTVFVWNGGPSLPPATPPVGSGNIGGTLKDGTALASPTSGTYFSSDYVMAYCVGPSAGGSGKPVTYPNIAASVYIPGGVGSTQPTQSYGSSLDIDPKNVSSTSIAFKFQFPPGTNPPANGAFIGLWYQLLTSPYTLAPQFTAAIPNTGQSYGEAVMVGIQLSSGSQYTAALYTSGLSGLTPGGNPPTTVAAWITFSVTQQ